MITIKLRNIDDSSYGFQYSKIEQKLLENGHKVVSGYERSGNYVLAMEFQKLGCIETVRSFLAGETSDRILMELSGLQRHAKMVSKENNVLAWASYDHDSTPTNLMHFNLPIRNIKNSETDEDPCFTHIYGLTSRKRFSNIPYFSRHMAMEIVKYGSWFNKEEVKMERMSGSKYEGMSFRYGHLCEKRGAIWHDDYMTSLEYIRFD